MCREWCSRIRWSLSGVRPGKCEGASLGRSPSPVGDAKEKQTSPSDFMFADSSALVFKSLIVITPTPLSPFQNPQVTFHHRKMTFVHSLTGLHDIGDRVA